MSIDEVAFDKALYVLGREPDGMFEMLDSGNIRNFLYTYLQLTERESVNHDVLKKTMMDHWLFAVNCNHEAKTDTAQCSCSRWRGEEMPSIGKAVENYFEHFWEAYKRNSIEGQKS